MGVDTSRFAYSERFGPRNGQARLLTIARLIEAKGIEYALRAIALLQHRHFAIQYTIVGDGPERKSLEAMGRDLGISQNLIFTGEVARQHVPALYRDADVFLLPSVTTEAGDEENQPVCLAEAQSSGLPVIATRLGGVPESMRDGESGFVVPQRDPQAIADALQWLIEHPKAWASMGRTGRVYVEQHYAIDKAHDRLEDVYRRLVADRGRNT